MNVEIWSEAAQFRFSEHLFRTFGFVFLQPRSYTWAKPGCGGKSGKEAGPEYLGVPEVSAGLAAVLLCQLHAELLLNRDEAVLVGPTYKEG